MLILDDDEKRMRKFWEKYPESTRVWNAADCIKELSGKSWSMVSLDMDLEGIPFDDPEKDNSGAAVVRWIVKNKPEIKEIVIHSYNHILSPKMVEILKGAGYDCSWKPFDLGGDGCSKFFLF